MRRNGTAITENIAGFASSAFNSSTKYSIILSIIIYFPVNLMSALHLVGVLDFFFFSKTAAPGSVTLQEQSCENTY